MIDFVKTTCPGCGQKIESEAIYAGETVTCPNCSATVQLPELPDKLPLRTPRRPVPPPRRQVPPNLQSAEVPPSRILDAYLLPLLFIIVGIAIGAFFGDSPSAMLWLAILSLCIFVLVVGHLGAIAARLKTIELLLRRK